MPSLLLSNVNRLSNKLDDLCILCDNMSVVALTETWLSENIADDAVCYM